MCMLGGGGAEKERKTETDFYMCCTCILFVKYITSGPCCVTGLGSGDCSAGDSDKGAAASSGSPGDTAHGSDYKTV